LTKFYSVIKNPVIIQPSVTFDPAVSAEVFPKPLSNLYAGQQLLITGRYKNAQNIKVTLSGQAYEKPVSYTYTINLSDSMQTKNQFLSKIWAKMKIENLLVSYYNVSPSSSAGMRYKEEIIIYSMLYGVSSPFTSVTGGGTGGGGGTGIFEEAGARLAEKKNAPADFELIGNYPNPFNPGTYISFRTAISVEQTAYVRIYNALGKLIREYTVNVSQPDSYRIYWDGMDSHNHMVSAGNYIYTISMGSTVLAGKMCLVK
ncbi:MAG: FlgD immunoglobulin-like domain containing protein, partial [Syntrophothermus sp.]